MHHLTNILATSSSLAHLRWCSQVGSTPLNSLAPKYYCHCSCCRCPLPAVFSNPVFWCHHLTLKWGTSTPNLSKVMLTVLLQSCTCQIRDMDTNMPPNLEIHSIMMKKLVHYFSFLSLKRHLKGKKKKLLKHFFHKWDSPTKHLVGFSLVFVFFYYYSFFFFFFLTFSTVSPSSNLSSLSFMVILLLPLWSPYSSPPSPTSIYLHPFFLV